MRPVCSRRAAYELDEQDFLDYLDCLDDPGILFAVNFFTNRTADGGAGVGRLLTEKISWAGRKIFLVREHFLRESRFLGARECTVSVKIFTITPIESVTSVTAKTKRCRQWWRHLFLS
jgi:hypothetical protein